MLQASELPKRRADASTSTAPETEQLPGQVPGGWDVPHWRMSEASTAALSFDCRVRPMSHVHE